jgi:hypothetical protein
MADLDRLDSPFHPAPACYFPAPLAQLRYPYV